jgi:hypothetical protein
MLKSTTQLKTSSSLKSKTCKLNLIKQNNMTLLFHCSVFTGWMTRKMPLKKLASHWDQEDYFWACLLLRTNNYLRWEKSLCTLSVGLDNLRKKISNFMDFMLIIKNTKIFWIYTLNQLEMKFRKCSEIILNKSLYLFSKAGSKKLGTSYMAKKVN